MTLIKVGEEHGRESSCGGGAAQPKGNAAYYWSVVTWHAPRMVCFFHLRNACFHHRESFLPDREPNRGVAAFASWIRGGLRFPSIRRCSRWEDPTSDLQSQMEL